MCIFMSNGLHQEKNFTVKWERDTKANIILFILVMHIREGMVVPNSAETRWNLVKRKKAGGQLKIIWPV